MKIKGIPLGISASTLFLLLPALLLLTTSCVYDSYDAAPQTGDGMAAELARLLEITPQAVAGIFAAYETALSLLRPAPLNSSD